MDVVQDMMGKVFQEDAGTAKGTAPVLGHSSVPVHAHGAPGGWPISSLDPLCPLQLPVAA